MYECTVNSKFIYGKVMVPCVTVFNVSLILLSTLDILYPSLLIKISFFFPFAPPLPPDLQNKGRQLFHSSCVGGLAYVYYCVVYYRQN